MNNKALTHLEIMNSVVSVEMVDRNEYGEGIFEVLTKDGYMYSDISEATIRDLRPELIY